MSTDLTWTARLYRWACQRLYNEAALLHDIAAWLVSLGRWAKWRRLAYNHLTGKQILEVGFGTGDLLIELAQKGQWKVIGLERAPAMQRITARKMKQKGIFAPRVRATTSALPFASASFDTILSAFPAEYIVEEQTLGEFARVLRSHTGRVVVVGLFVHLRVPGHPHLSETAVRQDRRARRLIQVAQNAGLQVHIVLHDDPPACLPVFILEKKA